MISSSLFCMLAKHYLSLPGTDVNTKRSKAIAVMLVNTVIEVCVQNILLHVYICSTGWISCLFCACVMLHTNTSVYHCFSYVSCSCHLC
jgi:hypothetical protein